jgi:hypothetical protein
LLCCRNKGGLIILGSKPQIEGWYIAVSLPSSISPFTHKQYTSTCPQDIRRR